MPASTFGCGAATQKTGEFDMLILVGWIGRDTNALENHVEERAVRGVPRPSSEPVFYRAGVTTAARRPRGTSWHLSKRERVWRLTGEVWKTRDAALAPSL